MTTLSEKLSATHTLLDTVALNWKRPVLMWSGGKDSMVLLFLLRSIRWSLPVLFHRDPWSPAKYEFADRIIREWNLTVYDYPPESVALQKANGVLEFVNHYQIGPGRALALPRNLEAPAPGEPVLCGYKDVLHRPVGSFSYPWDVVLHGHKSSDVDPLQGAVPLTVDVHQNLHAPAFAFPLRHWTDADIWEYTRLHDVPQQADRYNLETGAENPDKSRNPDWLRACTRCLDRDGPKQVACPKLRHTIDNLGAQVPYVDPARPDYIGKKN